MQSDTMKPILDKVASFLVVWKPLSVVGKVVTVCVDETSDVIAVAIVIRLCKKWRICKKWRVFVMSMVCVFQQQEICEICYYQEW